MECPIGADFIRCVDCRSSVRYEPCYCLPAGTRGSWYRIQDPRVEEEWMVHQIQSRPTLLQKAKL